MPLPGRTEQTELPDAEGAKGTQRTQKNSQEKVGLPGGSAHRWMLSLRVELAPDLIRLDVVTAGLTRSPAPQSSPFHARLDAGSSPA